MKRTRLHRVVAGTVMVTGGIGAAWSTAQAQSLNGSPGTMDRQNRAARDHDFTYLDNSTHVRQFVDAGYLVRIRSNADYRVKRLSHPYARPEVALFLTRLGRQYEDACGEQLVVTSLTRPRSRQPRNASPRSVHPTGMALDLRRSGRASCRRWLEGVLLHLEGKRVLEAVRERRPPHYHVALFPRPYAAYVASLGESDGTTGGGSATASALAVSDRYRVRRGDSLWEIARRHATTVGQLRSVNNLRGSRIFPGQLLTVPR